MAKSKKKWIQSAIKHPDALRKAAGVKKGKNIPEKKLVELEHSDNAKTARRARLAATLKRLRNE